MAYSLAQIDDFLLNAELVLSAFADDSISNDNSELFPKLQGLYKAVKWNSCDYEDEDYAEIVAELNKTIEAFGYLLPSPSVDADYTSSDSYRIWEEHDLINDTVTETTTTWSSYKLTDYIADEIAQNLNGLGEDTLFGEGAPSDALGNDGDQYFDTTGKIVYEKQSGSWTSVTDYSSAGGDSSSPSRWVNTNLVDSANAQGGFTAGSAGTPASGLTFPEAMDKLIFPATAPVVSLTVPSTTILYDQTAIALTISWTYTLKSSNATLALIKLERSRDGSAWTTLISSATEVLSYADTVNPSAADNSPIYYKLTVTDSRGGTNTTTSTKTFTIYSFFGLLAATSATEAQLEAMTSIATTNNDLTRTGITTTATEYVYYAYPASYGALTSIKDGGVEEVFSAFTELTQVSVTNLHGYVTDYRVYRSNSEGAFNNKTMVFS